MSRYQRKHSPTRHPDHHPIFISFFHLPRSIANYVIGNNLFPCPLWSTSWSGALHLIFHTFLHPISVFFSQHNATVPFDRSHTISNWPSMFLSYKFRPTVSDIARYWSKIAHFWATVCKTVYAMLSDRCLSAISSASATTVCCPAPKERGTVPPSFWPMSLLWPPGRPSGAMLST